MAPSSQTDSPESHMPFSAFAHIPDLQSLEFAVVLREEGNGEDIVSRMLPMSRIVPGEPKERERRPPPEKTSTKEPCMRPECVANLNRINELKEGNEMLKEQLEDVEIEIRQNMSRLEAIEKSNRLSDQQNDELETQMNDLDQQVGVLEIEAEDGIRQKRDLHKKIAQLEAEVAMFLKQKEERDQQREQATKSNQCEVVFGGISVARPPKDLDIINDEAQMSTPAVDRLFVNSLDVWDRNFGGSPTKQNDFVASMIRPSTTPGRIFKMPLPKYLEGKPEAARAGLSMKSMKAGMSMEGLKGVTVFGSEKKATLFGASNTRPGSSSSRSRPATSQSVRPVSRASSGGWSSRPVTSQSNRPTSTRSSRPASRGI
ncbi:hypothetical protein TrCOL_g8643 [Triparma columacea]|uniref:Uncharacterized protein n=1 Tax=Triparma columacea TaxID=722753 RepID=A0A9W7L391_9STRA|nr:hypothetical protein TrCOL_g8643 [Triparma columacea]